MADRNDQIEHISSIFKGQQENLKSIRKLSIRERKQKLKALKNAIFNFREELQKAIYDDFKKPALETDITEIYPAISEIKHTLSHLSDWAQNEYVNAPLTLLGSSSYIQYEPKGNVLVITPWNYPIYLSISPIVSAIAAGNTVILKPSEFTPNVNEVLKKLFLSVFPENYVAVIQGEAQVSADLLNLKFNHIHFTGSPAVGKIIMKAAAQHLASCTLELGGKSPTIVDETAAIANAASKIAFGKFINEGQTCIAPDYILVHEKVKDSLEEHLIIEIKNRYGKTLEEVKASKDLCRIVNEKHYNRLNEITANAMNNNANIAFGNAIDDNDQFISPTIITQIDANSRIMQEEIFGPLLPIITYQNLDEAISIINAKEKPLALYIFSKSNKNIQKILNETSSGGVCVNETLLHITNPNLPFGGVNNSGIGKSHGKWGFIDFSNEKAVLKQKLPFGASRLLYPPYTKFTKFVIDFTMKWL